VIEQLTLQNLLTAAAFIVIGGYAAVRIITHLVSEVKEERAYSRETEKAFREVHSQTIEVNKGVINAIENHTKSVDNAVNAVQKCEGRSNA